MSADEQEHDETLHDEGLPAALREELEAESDAPEADDDATIQDESSPAKPEKPRWKKALSIGLKVSVSLGGLYYVYGKAIGRDGLEELTGRISEISWGWFALAALMQLTAISFAIVRWRLLLGGQSIKAKWSFLGQSFMIGRFWGAFTPGGLGLDGWRLYDVANQTGEHARAVTITVVEKILGQLAFGLVVMGGSVWGFEMLGVEGVIMVNVFFVVLVTAGLTFIARPQEFQPLFAILPKKIQPRLQKVFDAVSAYHGKLKLLGTAVLCGVAVHAFNNMIYVSAAQAMHIELSPFVIFFASSIVIMSTILPLSLNGIGLREATAAGVLGAFGISPAIAAATYTLGWIAEMCVSAFGLPIWLARKHGYDARLEVGELDTKTKAEAEPPAPWPTLPKGLLIGAGAGLFAGMLVGLGEASLIVLDGGGRVGYGVLAYGAVAYGLLCSVGGAGFMLLIHRKMKREPAHLSVVYARLTGLLVAAMALALGAFRVRRDVFHEELAWGSKQGVFVFLGCVAGAALLYLLLSTLIRVWTGGRAGRFMLKAWGSPAFVGVIVVAVALVTTFVGPHANANGAPSRPAAPDGAPNVLVIVVDTLRADHLPGYGYANGSTPNLDRFAEDAVRYDQAFANASWTRPSFASILTGRYPSSHGVMAKPDALPDEVVTLPETLRENGYATSGLVTNFNVGPYFNFNQGFESYRFLEPEFVLGADDNAAKLLLVQALRRGIERYRAARGQVEPGSAYQDAETVNREIVTWLDAEAPQDTPWFMFVGYMDPHDPYFPHPYDGTGYSRAANQHPDPSEADALRDLYDGEITYWDEHFGALMDDLRERGLYDDTLIVITADHGEEFCEHGGFWHGTTLYDEQVHVPLFVKLPGNSRAGTHVSHWVQSIDLMPSILAHVGIDAPEGVQGGSLEEGTTRVYAEESHEGNVLESVRELRDFEELKMIVANPGNPRGLEPVELYRVADDPGEQDNVAESQREQVQGLMSVMEEARTQAAEGAVEGTQVEMDQESLCQLCEIGYVETEACCRSGCFSGSRCEGL